MKIPDSPSSVWRPGNIGLSKSSPRVKISPSTPTTSGAAPIEKSRVSQVSKSSREDCCRTQVKDAIDEVQNALIETINRMPDISTKEKRLFISQIKNRCAGHARDLDDFGYQFQQYYFAANKAHKGSCVASILDNSVPDRAVVSYLEELVRYQNSDVITSDEKDAICKCIEQIKESLAVALMTSVIISSPKKNVDIEKRVLQKYLTDKMNHLEIGQKLMIPSGFMRGSTTDVLSAMGKKEGHSFGHAIFIECEKKDSNKFAFTIFNTGMGIEEHESPMLQQDRVYSLSYQASLDADGIDKFLTNLVDCSRLPKSEREPVKRFYSCFADMTCIQRSRSDDRELRTIQFINSCTQFSVSAFLKSQMGTSLFSKFDTFFINDTEKKCEEFIKKLDHEHQGYALYYKHPGLKPKNRLHFLQIWIVSCFMIDSKVRLKDEHLAFELSPDQLRKFIADAKAVRREKKPKIQQINEDRVKILKNLLNR